MTCIKCGKAHNDYHFRTLHVETLHVRDIGKENRVQALGDFEEFDVCADCARAKYDLYMDNRKVLIRTSIPFVLLILAGIVITALFGTDGVWRLTGLGMAVGGAMCLYGNVRNRTAKKRELALLSEAEALYRCAWECLLESAPKKNDVNDITYIPVDEDTLARKNGDLMILYDLLPEIAIEAHKRIHADAEN
ncbi:MAG: hypothetical protein IJ960_03840 [Oscillospiraceae bacterium]|nr:hypothetical protein [Oscillospiraceae bacterium]